MAWTGIPRAVLGSGPSESVSNRMAETRADHFHSGCATVENLSTGGQYTVGVLVLVEDLQGSNFSGHRYGHRAFGQTSPLYFSEEFHTILRDFVTEPIKGGGYQCTDFGFYRAGRSFSWTGQWGG